MKTLKALDLTEERRLFAELIEAHRALIAKKSALEVLIDSRAAEYYGPDGRSGFFKANSHTSPTEDGYTITVKDHHIDITKDVDTGNLSGSGTIYDHEPSDLSFYLHLNSGRTGNGDAQKYAGIRKRMKELQMAEIIENPFKEFEKGHLLHFSIYEHMN